MNITYAAEKSSIAGLLSKFLRYRISPREIEVRDNPEETGSFLVQWRLNRYVLSPAGSIQRKWISSPGA